jgi:hypothetical protein
MQFCQHEIAGGGGLISSLFTGKISRWVPNEDLNARSFPRSSCQLVTIQNRSEDNFNLRIPLPASCKQTHKNQTTMPRKIFKTDWLGRNVVEIQYENGKRSRHTQKTDLLGRKTVDSQYVDGRTARHVHKEDWLGRKVVKSKFNDGYSERRTYKKDWLGRHVIDIKKGRKRCFKCNASVDPGPDGSYSCCGRRFF